MKKFLLITAIKIAVIFFSEAQNPLFIPPTLNGTVFNLSIQSGTTQFYPGINTPTYGINDVFLAPTLILNKWDVVTMNVTNNLNTSTTIHWHGLHLPAKADGGPHQIIMPSATWSPQFTVMNDAGTFWYHPHGENKTDLHVSKGITGLIIIKDSTESSLNLPRTYGVDDIPLIVQTKAFDILQQIAIATVMDTVPMVNGTMNPFLDAPAQVVRFRMLNGSSERTFRFGFSNNMNFYQIATDGGLLEQPVTLNRLELSPGERAEILADFSTLQGQTIFLKSFGSELQDGIFGAANVGTGIAQILDYNNNPLNGIDFNLLQINIVPQTGNPVTSIPSALATLYPWDSSQATVTRTLQFLPETSDSVQLVEGPFTINGKFFNIDTPNIITYKNSLEIWELQNKTLIAHSFHIHDIQFFILDISGNTPPPHMQGQKDVVLVMPNETVRFITKFTDFTDTVPYMYHCHLLHHEDDGMMGSFVVLDSAVLGWKESKTEKRSFSVYPNPANRDFSIKLDEAVFVKKIQITDLLGKSIFSQQVNAEKTVIHLNQQTENIQSGIYFVLIHTDKGILARQLVIHSTHRE